MRIVILRTVVVMLGVLTLASSASADCAWVLWQEYWETGEGRMAPKDNTRHAPEVVSGAPTAAWCLRERDRNVSRLSMRLPLWVPIWQR